MLKSSHVALMIPLKEPTGDEVTKHLGIPPTSIRELKLRSGKPGIEIKTTLRFIWQLDSPLEGPNSGERLSALIKLIAPFADRLVSLDDSYSRYIGLYFQYMPGIEDGRMWADPTGLGISSNDMSKLGAWNLPLMYETISLPSSKVIEE